MQFLALVLASLAASVLADPIVVNTPYVALYLGTIILSSDG